MIAEMHKFPAINSNPVLSVAKDGVILYSNEGGELLLHEWGMRAGEKLPPHIEILVQRAISRGGIEKIKIEMDKRVYFVIFHPLPEKEYVNIYSFDISDSKKLEGQLQESEAKERANLELANIIDNKSVQSLMNDFYRLAHIPMALLDLKGNILVSVGWQEICSRFHRVHPETFRHCLESDINLSTGVAPGEFKLYKCKNNMWDVVTPVIVEGQHLGNIFSGQFFLDNEPVDYELFRAQARKYGFNEQEYMSALEKVPRLSREAVDISMAFFMTFANMISQLSYSNIKLSQSLEEREAVVEALRESEKRERARSNELEVLLDAVPVSVYISHDSGVQKITGNHLSYEWLRVPVGTNFSKSAPEGEKPESFKLFKDGVEIPPEKMPSQIAATGREVNNCELDIVSADGRVRHVLGNARPLRDEQGNLRGSISAFIDITERKRVEEALLESESRLRLAQTSAGAGIWDWDISTDKLEWSEELFRLFGLDPGKNDASFDSWRDVLHPDDRLIAEKRVENAINNHIPLTSEYRIVLPSGEVRWINALGNTTYDSNGKPQRMSGICIDITGRKKVEEALQKSEAELSRAQRISLIGSWTWDLITGEVTWSEQSYRNYGLEPGELKPSYELFLSFIVPEDRERVDREVRQAILSGHKYKVTYNITRKDGTPRILLSENEIVTDESGKVVLMYGTNQDVTERKKAEEALKKAHDNLEKLVEERTAELEKAYKSLKESKEGLAEAQKMAHIGNWDWNIETNEEHWSDELYHIFGLDPQFELNHNTFLNCIHPDDFDYVTDAINEALNGNPYYINYRIILPDGEERIIYSEGRVLFDEKNKPVRMRGIVQDITERKKAEERLANVELARKKEIHHRIKNNLQVISSLLDLQADKFDNPKVIEAFRESQNRVISMALIHEELYKGGKTDTLNFSTYIKKLAENLFQTYSISSKSIHLITDLEENAFFDMDVAVPLGIIVNELVSNSLKHAFPGKDRGEIRIKLCREENGKHKKEGDKVTSFTLIVSDNGIGIPENLNIKVADSLGMQLITALVDQLDGELELKRNNGTEFCIRFTVTEKNNLAQLA